MSRKSLLFSIRQAHSPFPLSPQPRPSPRHFPDIFVPLYRNGLIRGYLPDLSGIPKFSGMKSSGIKIAKMAKTRNFRVYIKGNGLGPRERVFALDGIRGTLPGPLVVVLVECSHANGTIKGLVSIKPFPPVSLMRSPLRFRSIDAGRIVFGRFRPGRN